MKKELRPVHDNVGCDVCGRTMLKGERTETYLAPGGQRHQVCDLCFARAEASGWIRESGSADMPARVPRQEHKRPFLSRLRRRQAASPNGVDGDALEPAPEPPLPMPEPAEQHAQEEQPAPRPARERSRPKDPRHVRAVPTTAEVKVERALELFNGSDHQRTVAGLMRTLGAPLVAAAPDVEQPSAVSIVVAWELSWYRFRVDLGDEADPVAMLEKGEEMEQIDEARRGWNATVDGDGRLVADAVAAGGGGEAR